MRRQVAGRKLIHNTNQHAQLQPVANYSPTASAPLKQRRGSCRQTEHLITVAQLADGNVAPGSWLAIITGPT
jgi:hypothetical protein